MTYVGCNASLRKMEGNLQDQSSTNVELNNNRPNLPFRHLEMHQLQDEGFSSMNLETEEQVLKDAIVYGQPSGETATITDYFRDPDDSRQPLADSNDKRTEFVNHGAAAETPCQGDTCHCLENPGLEQKNNGEAGESIKVVPDHNVEPAVSNSVEQKKPPESKVNAQPERLTEKPPESKVNAEDVEPTERPPESKVNTQPVRPTVKPPESEVNAECVERKKPPEYKVNTVPVEPMKVPTESNVNMQSVRPKEKPSESKMSIECVEQGKLPESKVNMQSVRPKENPLESKVDTKPVEQKEKLQPVRPSESEVHTQSVRLRQKPSGSKLNPGAGGEPSNNIDATHQAGANFLSEVHLIGGQARVQHGLQRGHRRTGPEPFPSSVVDLGHQQNMGVADAMPHRYIVEELDIHVNLQNMVAPDVMPQYNADELGISLRDMGGADVMSQRYIAEELGINLLNMGATNDMPLYTTDELGISLRDRGGVYVMPQYTADELGITLRGGDDGAPSDSDF